MSDRQRLLAARRDRPDDSTPAGVLEARKQAHRLLRLRRGAEAARFSRGAVSAVVHPRAEFVTVEEWRAFLEPLYPPWAVEIGVELYDPDPRGYTQVVIAPDKPPHRRMVDPNRTIDVRFFVANGTARLTPEGAWDVEPGEPLPDQRPPDPEVVRDPDDPRNRFRNTWTPNPERQDS